MKRRTMKVAVIVFVAFGLRALAQSPPHSRGEPSFGARARGPDGNWQGGILERILQNDQLARELDLNEEQLAKIRKAAVGLKQQQIEKHAEMVDAALEQAQLLTQEDASEEAIMAAVEKTGRIRTEIAKLGMKRLLLIRETLTPEQQKKIHDMMRARARERRDNRGEDAEGRRPDWRDRPGRRPGQRGAGDEPPKEAGGE